MKESAEQSADYDRQRRGDRGAYERYLQGMNSSMRQKVALTAAHLLSEGKIADMGMGSGAGSEALAALYPALEVVGVDVEPTMVELARERYDLPNLSFKIGDIARPVFDPGSLDGIFDSSVLHHVTSFNGYDPGRAASALEVQVTQLREHGVLIVRDFLDPGSDTVWLDLPADDGDGGDDPLTCSTAVLFERFAREFRVLSEEPGFTFRRLEGAAATAGSPDAPPPLRQEWVRYEVCHRHAAEFVLRKDYRRDWTSEVQEAYTYFTQEEFEELFGRLGLRVLASTPIRNPWIVRHRFRDKIKLHTTGGEPLEFPATNYIIVGEKVPPAEGVRFREGEQQEPTGFLALEHYRHRETGKVMDLVRRPHRTLDIVPWFELEEDLFVLARASYPRPILRCDARGTASLGGARSAGYVTEPLVVIQTDKPLGTTAEETLARDAGISAEQIKCFQPGSTYYPSPGGIQEVIRASFVEVQALFTQKPLDNRSGFSTAGRILAMGAQQLLRAAQVGGLPDARLELNAYDLLLRCDRPTGPWIGAALELPDGATPARTAELTDLLARPPRRCFERVEDPGGGGFLELRCARFEELDASGDVRHGAPLEFVIPAPLSHNTVAAAPLRRAGGELWIGLDDDDLPAAQGFVGNSELLVAPAWRLPRELGSLTPALAWVRRRFAAEYGAATGGIWGLGGRYYPSLGATPEVVHPVAVEVLSEEPAQRSLTWVRLAELVAQRHTLRDGHLRIVAMRAAHALGVI